MRLSGILLALLLAACGTPGIKGESGATWVASPNYDERRPNFIIIHQTSNDNAAHALRTLTSPARKVSAHYLISRDGTVFQLVDERQRAWHAGASWWGGQTDINSASLGIELDNTGDEPFPQVQLDALMQLLAGLVARHGIPTANVIGHGDIAPTRKVDPSRYFPWQHLAEKGYGRWCEPAQAQGVADLDVRLGLRALGYDTTDLRAASLAFKRHFLADDSDPEMGEAARRMLACLLAQ